MTVGRLARGRGAGSDGHARRRVNPREGRAVGPPGAGTWLRGASYWAWCSRCLGAAGALSMACSNPVAPPGASAAPTPSDANRAQPADTLTLAYDPPPPPQPAGSQPTSCTPTHPLTLHFYDVAQALAVLVDLPDGRHILVDTGDAPGRRGCGDTCDAADRHLLARLATDLHGAPIDLLWITHQHSDHIGGAPNVLTAFKVGTYVDNGRDAREPEVRRAHEAAASRGTIVEVVTPGRATVPLSNSPDTTLTAIVPATWPSSCAHNPNRCERSPGGGEVPEGRANPLAWTEENNCSIGLRIDVCRSSVLFTGDAEHEEEARWGALGEVTLLQVGHHGSDTSTTPGLLAKLRPTYAVVSAGHPGEGMNRCERS
jgi:beta-lactamase superfamily II metal-dependent hydrolase